MLEVLIEFYYIICGVAGLFLAVVLVAYFLMSYGDMDQATIHGWLLLLAMLPGICVLILRGAKEEIKNGYSRDARIERVEEGARCREACIECLTKTNASQQSSGEQRESSRGAQVSLLC